MIQKIWTLSQMKQIEECSREYDIPIPVYEEIKKTLSILDECYGKDRPTGNEDGGCILLVLGMNEEEKSDSYNQILNENRLDTELVEFKDIIYENNNLKWYSELYLLTEYGITIIYSSNTDKNNGTDEH